MNGCYYDDSEIKKAKDDFRFFNEGDYITKEMANSKEKLFEYIEQLELYKDKEEIEKLIENMTKVRPEMLNKEGLKLFNTIMKILDERDNLKADNYEANNIINDYIDERERLIDKLERIVDDDEISDFEYQIKRELALEILSIVKGE